MSRILVNKTLKNAVIAGAALLALNPSSLWAQNPSEELTPGSEVAPCEMTPNQSRTDRQCQPRMAQQGSMMGQGRHGSGGWGHGSQYGRMYDSNSVETISGEVVSVDTFTPMGGMSGGMNLRLKADDETVDVHLGPAWYLQNQDISIEPKDKIEVKGSKVDFNGQFVLMAAQVKKGDATLMLRDESGFPVWHGWRGNQ